MSDPERAAGHSAIRIARRSYRCSVLGPGVRAVVWVQGCPFRCRECVAPETLSFSGGTNIETAELAEELGNLQNLDGITFSGGEPMSQAMALATLSQALRAKHPEWNFLSYTGYSLKYLRDQGTDEQRAFLGELDVLVDGPYLPNLHCDLLWRGSSNQQIHFLTSKLESWAPKVNSPGHRIEFELLPDQSIQWMGIPPKQFRERFEQAMASRGIKLATLSASK